jgi:hypothetical protein
LWVELFYPQDGSTQIVEICEETLLDVRNVHKTQLRIGQNYIQMAMLPYTIEKILPLAM